MIEFRRDRTRVLMSMAQNVASLGTCSRLQVGALIVYRARVISTGYNGAPAKMPHCRHEGNEPCLDSVHAEANAIAFAARLGGAGTEGSTLIVTHAPCLECAKLIINAGIREVIYGQPYRRTEGLELLANAGVIVTQLN